MKYAWVGCLLFGGLLFASPQDSESNVNARYTVETVIISGKGWTADLQSETTDKISSGLRHQLVAIIGQKLNPAALDSLAQSLKKELNAREVTHRIVRGTSPEHVRVEFEVKPARGSVGMNVTQFVYDSKQGWSGSGEATFSLAQNTFAFGLVSDGDWLPERYAGISARYENRRLGTDRVSLRFQFESYHEQWNMATITDLAAHPNETSDLYRSRQDFEPTATIALAHPLTLMVGARIERFESEVPAAGTEASNAVITTLRYHRRLEGSDNQQDLDADASLHAATNLLGSDFVYAMRSAGIRYQLRHGKHVVMDNAWAGVISGRAPLCDRFSLGNTYYLRGWNKYEIDPLGGNRAVHNSVEYHYGAFQIFYDVGAVWDEGQPAVPRHSLGVGVRESALSLAVAFPIRSGHVEPIVMMGILP
ncbi:MAG TPA: BamA/TamA family outer membrane protein [Bryobacteraceae bacterium]|nr:BamA/TamA family outer membrane protein [Bryobacteraceae bacterium]